MATTPELSDWKVSIINDPVLYKGSGKDFRPPHPGVYRIVLWEKPYVAEWFRQTYRTSLTPSAVIAYSRYVMHGMYATPPREWRERNMPLIAVIHLYNSIILSEVLMRKFPEEFQWAQELWDARINQRNLIASSSDYGLF